MWVSPRRRAVRSPCSAAVRVRCEARFIGTPSSVRWLMQQVWLSCGYMAMFCAPGTRLIRCSGEQSLAEALQDHGHAHAAADAHGLQPDLLVVPLQAVDQRRGDPGAGHAERVAQGD